MSTSGRTALVAVLLSSTLAMAGSAAGPQAKPRTFEGAIEMVTVDVSVLGPDRQPVRGLSMEDFSILEDGRPQPIKSFASIDFADPAPVTAPWLREVPGDVHRNDDLAGRRFVVLVMDDATPMDAEDGPRLRKMAHAVIDHLGPRDLAAVLYAMDKKNGQDLTGDRARLLAAIDRFTGGVTMNAFSGKVSDAQQGNVKVDASDFDLRALSMYEALFDTLRGVSEELGALPQRRKSVILVSLGPPLDVGDAGPRIGLSGGKDSGLTRRLFTSLQAVFEAAERSNVNIYGLGPGLKVARDVVIKTDGSTNRDVGQMNTDFLKTVSVATGGFAIVDQDDPAAAITQVLAENGSYYLLGYEPANTRADGRFRRIEVRVNRPDVTVRSRAGYYESASAVRPPEKASLQAAMQAFLPKADVGMLLSAAPFAVANQKNAAVAVMVGIRQPRPALKERTAEKTDLLVSAYDQSGQRRGAERLEVSFMLPAGDADDVGYETLARLDLPPGRYQLRLATQTALLGRTGSVFCDLDVPDFSRAALSLSGLVLTATPAPIMMGKDKLASLLPVLPTTLRDLSHEHQKASVFMRVYQGGKDPPAPVTVAATILDGTGAPVFEATEALAPDKFSSGRAADYRLELPLTRLAPGPHLLTVEATGPGGTRVKRDVRFNVR